MLCRRQVPHDPGRADEVIGIAVGEDHRLEARDAERAQRRHHDTLADVEAGRLGAVGAGRERREPAGIDEHRRAAGQRDDGGVTLPDVEDDDAERQASSAARRRAP